MKRGFKKWAESKSEELRKELSLKYYEKLPAEDLASHLNIGLLTPNEIQGLSDVTKALLLNHDSNSWSAITIKNFKGNHIIIYNPTHSPRRKESNLMHEVSHIICEHEMEKIQVRNDFAFPFREYNENQEEEANWLGSCLQIPRRGMVWGKYKGMTNCELAEHFGASLKMLEYRLNITGVTKQIKRRYH